MDSSISNVPRLIKQQVLPCLLPCSHLMWASHSACLCLNSMHNHQDEHKMWSSVIVCMLLYSPALHPSWTTSSPCVQLPVGVSCQTSRASFDVEQCELLFACCYTVQPCILDPQGQLYSIHKGAAKHGQGDVLHDAIWCLASASCAVLECCTMRLEMPRWLRYCRAACNFCCKFRAAYHNQVLPVHLHTHGHQSTPHPVTCWLDLEVSSYAVVDEWLSLWHVSGMQNHNLVCITAGYSMHLFSIYGNSFQSTIKTSLTLMLTDLIAVVDGVAEGWWQGSGLARKGEESLSNDSKVGNWDKRHPTPSAGANTCIWSWNWMMLTLPVPYIAHVELHRFLQFNLQECIAEDWEDWPSTFFTHNTYLLCAAAVLCCRCFVVCVSFRMITAADHTKDCTHIALWTLQLELVTVQAQRDEAQTQRTIVKQVVTDAQIAYEGFLRDLDAMGSHWCDSQASKVSPKCT